MLKRLELTGFKSFADKTPFDFPAGITGIVGPNGSGKSNIVDGVRWVLGEQSAKSLRGGEMADVIFNGSASRRSVGLAEVALLFDNSRRSLASDAEEVLITRRVYRSGESEYLINNQPCRLRDIKELFLGSGAGTDAYCIIQQGQVDVLLQASTKERRTIFEEAAGISRFKAKKTETLRRLERVDQNLQRLKDIIDEVEKQLRSVKLQAAKAQRYQEYTEELKRLRVRLGLQEYRELAARLDTETAALEHLRVGLEEQSSQATAWEAEVRRLEEALAELEEALRTDEGLLAAAKQTIATAENTLGHERALSAELESDLTRTRGRLTELNARVAALAAEAAEAVEACRGVEAQSQEQRGGVIALENEIQGQIVRLGLLQKQVQADKAQHFEQMRQTARLQNDVVSFKAQVDNLRRERERLQQRTAQAAENLASLDLELRELTEADEALQARLAGLRQGVAEQKQERDRLRQVYDDTAQLAGELRAQRSGLASRIEVLEGLERSHEGLGTGVREVYDLLQQADPGPWRTVLGLTADFLTVRREFAPLIDLALGERAQRFVVRDAGLLAEALAQRGQPFSGRVSFWPLPPSATPRAAEPEQRIVRSLLGPVRFSPAPEGTPVHPGVVAAAEQLVTCDNPDFVELPAKLLRGTLLVRDLDAAGVLLAQHPGFRFVTLRGELLEADGTLTTGAHHAESGILSRKSELREARQQAQELDGRLAEIDRDLAELRERTGQMDARATGLQEEIDVLTEQSADLRTRLGQRRERREGLHEEVHLSRHEISNLEPEVERLEAQWQQARQQAEEAEQRAQGLQSRVEQAEQEIRQREELRQTRQQEYTAAKVALAQVDERLMAFRARARQLEDDARQRRQEQADGESQLAAAQARLEESQRLMQQAEAELAQGKLDREAAGQRCADLVRRRDEQRRQRQQLAERAQAARGVWQTHQEQAHARELEVNQQRHRRDSLVERLREDYQLDLEELHRAEAGAPPAEPVAALDPAAANEEIAELRRKLSRLGSVNLDSLQELAELETRATSLQAQFDDLAAAKRALEEIIAKINQDSRRLFTDTFGTIRTNFQELFRKLFGGGMADVVLEDENDILECGIEIVARPPGKELRSISLMSGGEKTMTAVALLLAIFRSKPSPFCILDEVDAALDEANIGRFTAVLREFMDRSQFILITHSKRTMAAADVLYGITMQESGISKRVSINYVDWVEENQTDEPAA